MLKQFDVEAINAGERLDLFLTIKENSLSRSQIRKTINAGKVKVNGQIEFKPNYRVKPADKVEIDYEVEENTKLVPENIALDIIYEDESLIVINKPAGMVVHPATGNWKGTLVNAIVNYNQKLAAVGNKLRPALIHRLDKDTSGIILVGKSNEALWFYSKQFAERNVKKTYAAILKGNFLENLGKYEYTVKNYIGRSNYNRKKFAAVPPSKGKLAETKFNLNTVIKKDDKFYSAVEASPVTGRTHQIRVHASGFNMPILGDIVYGKNNNYARLMLHAWKISLKLLNGRDTTFIAPLPYEFKEFVQG